MLIMLAPRQLKSLANVRLMRRFSVVLAEDFHMQTASNSMLACLLNKKKKITFGFSLFPFIIQVLEKKKKKKWRLYCPLLWLKTWNWRPLETQ